MPKTILPITIGFRHHYNLLQKLLEYCGQPENQNLKNLKMVIGATDMYSGDVNRLGKEYDIAIDDSKSHCPDTDDGLLTIDSEKNTVYDKLEPILSDKFSQIIFDYSVTKFIRNSDLSMIIPKLGNLLQSGGLLYIDEFSSCPYGGCIGLLWTTKINNKYILQTQTYDETVQHYTMEKRKVNKNEKDVFARQRVQFGIRDYESGNTYRNIDMYKLFDNMDENGYFDESMFQNTISYRDESYQILSNALSFGFKIEFCEDDQYPENKERISKYWKITKNSITIKI
jgi:hypothetical protein